MIFKFVQKPVGIECERFVIFQRHILRVFSDNLCLEFLFPVSAITLKIMVSSSLFFILLRRRNGIFQKLLKHFTLKNHGIIT